jgi:hypothetical protein
MAILEFINKITGIAITIIWIFVAFYIAFITIVSKDITFNNPQNFINSISNACITVSSITLAAIFAIIAIIETKSPEKAAKLMPISAIPIFAIILSLFSLYFSFFESSFQSAKGLLAGAMELTVASIIILYIMVDKVKFSSKDGETK